MGDQSPLYDSYVPTNATSPHARPNMHYGIKVARNLNDIMQVTAIRAAVFMSEQRCPYEEEFDGNDFCGTHLIGYHRDEPIACLRARFFCEICQTRTSGSSP
jgi:predicted GNAT family N-acyltransferase